MILDRFLNLPQITTLNIERRGVLLTWIIIVGQWPIALEVGRVGLLLYHFIGGGGRVVPLFWVNL